MDLDLIGPQELDYPGALAQGTVSIVLTMLRVDCFWLSS